MNKILIITKHELFACLRSPLAYIVLMVTTVVFNIFFFMIIDQNREASLREVFLVMEFMFVFLVPLVTMRIFAQEKSSGTMEFLLTTPTSAGTLVMGKYLGTLAFFSLMLAPAFVYYLIIECFSSPDRAAILTGYFGVWLEGAMFLAVGILTSSWTKSQTMAALTSYAILFFLYFSMSFISYVSGPMEQAVRHIATLSHLENFAVGVITTADMIYYVSIIVFCLYLTRLSITTRIWQ